MAFLERTTKTAAAVSVLLILGLQLSVHPDMTTGLRAACVAAAALTWLLASRLPDTAVAIWVGVATISPAAVRLLAFREGPVGDVVWMGGLAGALLRGYSWSRWQLPDGWAPLAGAWALTLSAAWPIVVAREISFDPALLYGTTVNSWAMFGSAPATAPLVVGWTLHVAITQLLGLLWFDWLARRLREPAARTSPAVHALWIGATAASLVACYQGAVDLHFLSTDQWATLRRATGTMLDANAYGVCAAIAGPLAFVLLRTEGSHRARRLAALVLMINLAGMWMSGSRTAFLCAVIVLMSLGLAVWSTSGRTPRHVTPLAVGVLVTIAAAAVLAASAIGPVRRILDMGASPAAIVAEFWHREPYGPIAARMIREYPLTGVGIGAYNVLAPDYWHGQSYDLPFDNAQNWWRHEAAELGLLGGLPAFALSLALLWRIVSGRARDGQDTVAILARGSLLSLGLVSLVGLPTQNGVVLLWFFLFAVLLLQALRQPALPLLAARARQVWVAAAAMVLVHAALSLLLARGSLAVDERARRWHRIEEAGAVPKVSSWYNYRFDHSPRSQCEGRDSPDVQGSRGAVRVRQHVHDALDEA